MPTSSILFNRQQTSQESNLNVLVVFRIQSTISGQQQTILIVSTVVSVLLIVISSLCYCYKAGKVKPPLFICSSTLVVFKIYLMIFGLV